MKIHLDEAFGKIWVDNTVPCIFTTINQQLQQSEINALSKCESYCLKITHKKGAALYLVTNFGHCEHLSKEMVTNYTKCVLLPQQEKKNTYRLIIKPKNEAANAFLINTVKLFPYLNAAVVSTFEDALSSINRIKISRLEKMGCDTFDISNYNLISSLAKS